MTGDVTIKPDAPLLIMTTEIFRNTIFEDAERARRRRATSSSTRSTTSTTSSAAPSGRSRIIFAPKHVRFVVPLGDGREPRRSSATGSRAGRAARDVERDRVTRAAGPARRTTCYRARASGRKRGRRGAAAAARSRGAPRRAAQRGATARASVATDLLDRARARAATLPALFFCFSRRECERARARTRAAACSRRRARERIDAALRRALRRASRSRPTRDARELRALALARRRLPPRRHAADPQGDRRAAVHVGAAASCCSRRRRSRSASTCRRARWCFASLRKFDGVGFDYLHDARLPCRWPGAPGRQGIDAEGLVYLDARRRRTSRRRR